MSDVGIALDLGKQAPPEPHGLASFGYSLPPFWLWRRSRRAYALTMAIKDIWLIARGRITLHRAYQKGRDDNHVDEVMRHLAVTGQWPPPNREGAKIHE